MDEQIRSDLENIVYCREGDISEMGTALAELSSRREELYMEMAMLNELMDIYETKVKEGMRSLDLYMPLIDTITSYLEMSDTDSLDFQGNGTSNLGAHILLSHYRTEPRQNRSDDDIYFSYRENWKDSRSTFSVLMSKDKSRRHYSFRHTTPKNHPHLARSCRSNDIDSFASDMTMMLRSHMLDGGQPGESVTRLPFMLQRFPGYLVELSRSLDIGRNLSSAYEEIKRLEDLKY